MIYSQNLHTHSTYCDGKNTLEELVLRAIELGFSSIGFSGHSYTFYSPQIPMSLSGTEEYKNEISQLKVKYKDIIEIYCGLEFDMYSGVSTENYDYIIGTVHYLRIKDEYVSIDTTAENLKKVIDNYFDGDGLKCVAAYYETLSQLPRYTKVDILGHFDIITKNCEKANLFDINSKEYKILAIAALRELSKNVRAFEINTGAIARGYRTTPYPAPFILKELNRLSCPVVISSDCHDKQFLNYKFDETISLMKDCGFKQVHILTGDGFRPLELIVYNDIQNNDR